MLSFRLFNIPVHVQPWFWLTLVLIGGGLGANNAEAIMIVGMFVLAGFISILVHEFGHALMIKKYRLPTEVHLVAFGGFARYPAGQLGRKESFLVTAAGPAIQIALGVIALIILRNVPVPQGSLLHYMLLYLVWVSFVWAILNCLPVYPLDGGQMLAAIMGPNRIKTVFLIGIIVSIAVGLIAFLLLQAWLLLIFMGFFAYQNWQQYANAPKK